MADEAIRFPCSHCPRTFDDSKGLSVHTTVAHGKKRKTPTVAGAPPLRALRRPRIADGVAEPMETCSESHTLTEPLTGSPTPGEEDQHFSEFHTK